MSKINEENGTDPMQSTLQMIMNTPIPNQSLQLEELKNSIARSHEESLNTPGGDHKRLSKNRLTIYSGQGEQPIYENMDLLKHNNPKDILIALDVLTERKLMRSAEEVEKDAFAKKAMNTGIKARLP
jgi:hypothetical protein